MPPTEEVSDEQEVEIPEDYRAFTAFRDGTAAPEPKAKDTPAPGDKAAPSESAVEDADPDAGQIAEESDPAEETEQEDAELIDPDLEDTEDPEPVKGEKGEKNNRLSRRMRDLTGQIAALKLQIEGKPPNEPAKPAKAEVASVPEPVAEVETAAPMLKDFEDTDELSAWDQYEAATRAFNKAETAKEIKAALATQAKELNEKHAAQELETAKQAAQADWNKASLRFSDYNEVVSDKVQISAAMESVMRMDPEAGTELAYYLGGHPEESLAIANATLANSEAQWTTALARAGMELGKIKAKLPPPGAPKKPAPPTATPTKTVTSASRVPTPIRGGTAPPKPDVMSDTTAADYKKWNAAREAQLKSRR